jgi:hypothetical protein
MILANVEMVTATAAWLLFMATTRNGSCADFWQKQPNYSHIFPVYA